MSTSSGVSVPRAELAEVIAVILDNHSATRRAATWRDSRRRMVCPAQSARGNDTGLEIAESRVTQMAAAGLKFNGVSELDKLRIQCRWVPLTLIIITCF